MCGALPHRGASSLTLEIRARPGAPRELTLDGGDVGVRARVVPAAAEVGAHAAPLVVRRVRLAGGRARGLARVPALEANAAQAEDVVEVKGRAVAEHRPRRLVELPHDLEHAVGLGALDAAVGGARVGVGWAFRGIRGP